MGKKATVISQTELISYMAPYVVYTFVNMNNAYVYGSTWFSQWTVTSWSRPIHCLALITWPHSRINELVRFTRVCEIHSSPKHSLSVTHKGSPLFCKHGPIPRDRAGENFSCLFKESDPQDIFVVMWKRVWEMCSWMAWLEWGVGTVLPSTKFLQKVVRTEKASVLISIPSAKVEDAINTEMPPSDFCRALRRTVISSSLRSLSPKQH